jgi:hypothetical protein
LNDPGESPSLWASLAERRARRRARSDDDDFFAALRRVEGLVERQRNFLGPGDSDAEATATTSELVALGVSRVQARERFLARKEKLVLAGMLASVLAAAGVAISTWVLVLHGNLSAVLRVVGL